jgi:hypothetical protein
MTTRPLAVLAVLAAAAVATAAPPPPPVSSPSPSSPPAAPAASSAAARPAPPVDSLTLGDPAAEAAHGLDADRSDVVTGGLGQPARRLLPGGSPPWAGGRIQFTLKVDPGRQTYLTARFWGDEANPNFLVLFCEGKQVGYRHLGDLDVLALPDDDPRYNGRFYYVTTPLPAALTAGKASVRLEIRSYGPVWGYARTFEQYQKPMTVPSRGVYRLATHTDPCYAPEVDDPQGAPPADVVRAGPGDEVLAAAKARVNATLDGLLKATRPLNQMQAQLLAKAYFVRWTSAFNNPKVVAQVTRCADDRHRAWVIDPEAVWRDPSTWNPEWFGLGPAADAVRLLAGPLAPALDVALDAEAHGGKTRRAAWAEMFAASRDWLRTHRRWYTNQTIFVDTNLYRSHLGVAAVDPTAAWPDAQARRYLHEALGLRPWLGSDTPDGGSTQQWGANYFQVTDKGLSRELGYVGGYGEILGQMVDAYDATRPPGGEGDPAVKAQIAKVQRARLFFRYPMPDADGNRAMRLAAGVGWRDTHFPGAVTYGQRAALDETALYAAAVTLDPPAVGAARQMLADSQFFASVAAMTADRRLRGDFGLLSVPDDYGAVRAAPASEHRLPMTPGQPDAVFADEQDGVVAVKHGDAVLYASLYWRSRTGINGLARVHYLTPRYQQLAVVREAVRFEASGQTWKRPNWTNFGFGNGGLRYPGDLQSAHAGEELPIPKLPADAPLVPNADNPYAGRADFYQLRYGPYLIAMNTTTDRTFDVARPADGAGAAGVGGTASASSIPGTATDVATGKTVRLDEPLTVKPRSTLVLFFGPARADAN